MDCFALSGGAKALQNNPEWYSTPRVHYAHAIHGLWRVIVLFSLLKLSKFQIEDKSKTQRVHPCSALVQSFLKTKKAWS